MVGNDAVILEDKGIQLAPRYEVAQVTSGWGGETRAPLYRLLCGLAKTHATASFADVPQTLLTRDQAVGSS